MEQSILHLAYFNQIDWICEMICEPFEVCM